MTPPAPLRADAAPQVDFYRPANGSPTRPRFKLKHNDTFAVIDNHGDIGASLGDADGVFNRDTRYLSRLELRLDGQRMLLLGSRVSDDNAVITVDLTNPEIRNKNRIIHGRDTIHIVRTAFLNDDTLHTKLAIQNFDSEPVTLQIELLFGSDFADIFEARGMERPRRGSGVRPEVDASIVALAYRGLDGATYETSLGFEPAPHRLGDDTASWSIRLNPREKSAIFVSTHVGRREARSAREAFVRGLRNVRHIARSEASVATIHTSSEFFNQTIARSMADLRMLITRSEEGDYPYAGIPWYSTIFGRDGLITALQLLWCMPTLARGVLRRLAALQATVIDPSNDAEPGKIVHEMRGGEMAHLREVPFGRYYGTVDATPLFVLLAGKYAERTGDIATLRALWPNILAALNWIDRTSAMDQHGFLRHARPTDGGLANQGWKDSFDSIFHANGQLAQGSIALIEVQAYIVAAKASLANVADTMGSAELAKALRWQAAALADRIEQHFWCDDLDTYGIAIDGAGDLCRVRTSNAGHMLFAHAASASRASRVAETLMSPRFQSGWGIRTVAEDEPRYNPISYHNGSIWPHDNALIAMGLASYGFRDAASVLLDAMSDVASHMDAGRLPELFCGFRRSSAHAPTMYPVACAPQAWASATPLAMLQACLGLQFDPAETRIRFHAPVMPASMDEVRLTNLRIGAASVDCTLRGSNGAIVLDVTRNDGGADVAIVK